MKSRSPRRASTCWVESLENRQLLSVTVGSAKARLLKPIARPVHVQKDGKSPLTTAAPTGLSPSIIRGAYGVNNILFGSVSGTGAGQTIAIIDAQDDPNIVSSALSTYVSSDLYKFNSYFGLQQFGSGGPTFTKVNQTGGTSYPTADSGWSGEIALDVEWAHVIAPMANILLVEATSATDSNLFNKAANYAKSVAGVTAVSMSFGGVESSGDTSFNSVFSTQATGHANVSWFSSSGDDGGVYGGTYASDSTSGGPEYPSDSPYVVAVGGTYLSTSGTNYVSESGWTGSGGGISAVEAKPGYQSSITLSSSKRTVPDIAMDADPNSGVPVLDSYGNGTTKPWAQYGGTSLSSPMWAGLDAILNQGLTLSGQSTFSSYQLLSKLYAAPTSLFHDITSGTNGLSTSVGYDLVTGIGSPITNTLIPYLAGTTIGVPSLASASDSGISNSDRITNVTKPTFTGTTGSTGTVNLLVDGSVAGSATGNGSTYSITLSSALTNGSHTITAAIGSIGSASSSVTIDTIAPNITTSAFNYLIAAHSVTVGFSEDVSATTAATDFTVTNTTSGTAVSPALTYAASTNVATLSFPGFANGTLPQGNYIATAAVASITDVAGNALATALNFKFFFLPGDTDHNGVVDVSDLSTLAQNWQTNGNFTLGDFDYNGFIDVSDLSILAQNWQVSLTSTTAPTNTTAAPTVSDPVASLATSKSTAADPPTTQVSPFASANSALNSDIDMLI